VDIRHPKQPLPLKRPQSKPRKPQKPHSAWLFSLLLTVVAGALVAYGYSHDQTKTVSSTNTVPITGGSTIPKTSSVDTSALDTKIAAILATNPNVTVSLSAIELGSGQSVHYGTSTAMTAASVTKVVTAIDFLHEVELGKYSLSMNLSDDDQYGASWQLQQMINQSNNDSWLMFENLLGYSQLANYIHTIGATSFDFNTNSITTDDQAKIMQLLYAGQLLNASDTKLLLSYMQNTNDEDLLPPAISHGDTIWHKYGEFNNQVNDAAIINHNGHDYVLVIFTNRSDVPDETDRDTLFHELTQTILAKLG
jgi:beta-lactamase class A